MENKRGIRARSMGGRIVVELKIPFSSEDHALNDTAR
jgi:hypothetical protein